MLLINIDPRILNKILANWILQFPIFQVNSLPSAAAAAKSLQSCLTLCEPIDGSPPGSSVPGILQAINQRSNCQHLLDHGKIKSSRKASISALLTMPKPLTMWITMNCGKFWKRWDYQTTWPASWEICTGQEETVRTGHGTTDWLQIGRRSTSRLSIVTLLI